MEEKDFHSGHADLVMLENDDFQLPAELDRLDIDFTECFIGDARLDHVQLADGCGESHDCDGVFDEWAIIQVLQPCSHCVDKMQLANSSSNSSSRESCSDGPSSIQLGDLSGIKTTELTQRVATDKSECEDLSMCLSDESEGASSWSETCSGCTLCDAEFDLDLISLLTHGGTDSACLPDTDAISAEEMVASWVQQCSEQSAVHPGTCFYKINMKNVMKRVLQKTFLRKFKVMGKLKRAKQHK